MSELAFGWVINLIYIIATKMSLLARGVITEALNYSEKMGDSPYLLVPNQIPNLINFDKFWK